MTKQVKARLKLIPYYKGITRKNRFTNPVKDKAWTLLSDFVRCRDFIKYKKCVSCGRTVAMWRILQGGHFINMSSNGASIGFSVKNVFGQCPFCNFQSSQHTGADFEREIVKRGIKIQDLKKLQQQTVKADDWFFIAKIEEIWGLFQELKKEHDEFDFPEYLYK